MGNERDVTIFIKADGSVAVKEAAATVAALQKLKAEAQNTGQGFSQMTAQANAGVSGIKAAEDRLVGTISTVNETLKSQIQTTGQGFNLIAGNLNSGFASIKAAEDRLIPSLESVNRTLRAQMEAAKFAASGGDALVNELIKIRGETQKTVSTWAKFKAVLKDNISFSGVDSLDSAISTATGAINQLQSIAGTVNKIIDFGAQGAEIAELRENLNALAGSYGVSADAIISESQKASRGMVSDYTLMQGAAKVLELEVTTSSQEIAKIWEISEAKADVLKRKQVDVFNEITDAIGKGTARQLLALGLVPESMARAGTGMDLMMKKTDLLRVVLEQGSEAVNRLKGAGDSAADNFARFKTSVENLSNGLKETFLPILNTTVEFLNNEVMPAIKEAIRFWSDWLGIMGIAESVYAKQGPRGGEAGKKQDALAAVKKEYAETLAAMQAFAKEAPGTLTVWSDMDYHNSNMKLFADRLTTLKNQIKGTESELQRLYNATENRKVENKVNSYKSTYKDDPLRSSLLPLLSTGFAMDPAGGMLAFMNSVTGKEADKVAPKLKGWREEQDKLKDSVKAADRASKEYIETINRQATAAYDLAKGTVDVLLAMRDFKQLDVKNEFDLMEKSFRATAAAIPGVSAAIGTGLSPLFREATLATADFVGELDYLARLRVLEQLPALINAYANEMTFLGVSAKDALPYIEKAVQSMNPGAAAVDFITDLGKSLSTQSSDATANRLLAEQEAEQKRLADDLKKKLTINVRDAFEDGLYEAMNGGDFFKAFGENLKRQVTQALAASLTNALFSGGTGTVNIAGVAQQGSNGLVNSLLKPVTSKNGAVNWGNLGTNLLTGAAVSWGVDRLFGAGGLFGSRKINGAEAVTQAASINDQVKEADVKRWSLYSSVGISAATAKALDELRFSGAGYTWSNSGDGLFSKKTTTYALNAAAAQESLGKFAELQKKAEFEAAARELEKAMVAIIDPVQAFTLNLEDLKSALERTGDPLKKQELQVQIAQQESQWKQARLATTQGFLDTYLANPYLSFAQNGNDYGFSQSLIDSMLSMGTTVYGANTNTDAWRQKFFGRAAGKERAVEYDLYAEQLAAGDDIEKQIAYQQKIQETLESRLDTLGSLKTNFARQMEYTGGSMEEQLAAIERYQQANSAFWETKSALLDNETQIAALMAAKADEAAAALEKQKQAEEAAATAQRQNRRSSQQYWLDYAVSNGAAAINAGGYDLYKMITNQGTADDWRYASDEDQQKQKLQLGKESGLAAFQRQIADIESQNDPEKRKKYLEDSLENARIEANFFEFIMNSSWSEANYTAHTLEERQAAENRYATAQEAFYNSKLEVLRLEAEQQDLVLRAQEEAAAAAEKLQQAQEEAVQRGIAWQNKWLGISISNQALLSDGSERNFLASMIGTQNTSTSADSDYLLQEMDVLTRGLAKAFEAQKTKLLTGADSDAQIALAETGIADLEKEAAFFREMADRELTLINDQTRSYAEKRAAMERRIQEYQEYYGIELEILQLKQKKEEELKKKQEEALSKQEQRVTDLYSAMSKALVQQQENGGNKVYLLMPGATDRDVITQELKGIINGTNPELAALFNKFLEQNNRRYAR
jgi:hypothetical protein